MLLEQLETTTCLNQKVSYDVICRTINASLLCTVTLGHVGSDVMVTDECIIGAACSVDGTESLPHRTIICGSKNQRYLLAQPPSVSPHSLFVSFIIFNTV